MTIFNSYISHYQRVSVYPLISQYNPILSTIKHYWAMLTVNTPPIFNPGWWFQPLWKILVNWEDYSQYMGEKNMFQTTSQCWNPKKKSIKSHSTTIFLWFSYGFLWFPLASYEPMLVLKFHQESMFQPPAPECGTPLWALLGDATSKKMWPGGAGCPQHTGSLGKWCTGWKSPCSMGKYRETIGKP